MIDPAQTSHCLTLSQAFAAKSDGLVEKNRSLAAAFPSPDADQAATIARTTRLQAQLAQIAESLKSFSGDAPGPRPGRT